VGKVMGKSVDRNRIKRRMKAALGNHLSLLTVPVDVVLHPKRNVIEWDFPYLDREVAAILSAIQRAAERQLALSHARGASEIKTQ
jgi:ribonuclease P protein component